MDAKKLKIIFFGTPDFAVASLRRLVEGGYNVVGVVTSPDKPAGRGLKLQQSAVKEYASVVGLPVFQPEKLRDEVFLAQLRALTPDLGIVIAFRMLPEAVWSMPRFGTFNLHASLLPEYRGAAPINWAIINGETRTGVTTFMLNHEIDTGDILAQCEVDITLSDTAGTLHDKLMEEGGALVVDTVEALAAGKVQPMPQVVTVGESKTAPKIFKEDCRIVWDAPGKRIVDMVRGLSPFPGAWSMMAGLETDSEPRPNPAPAAEDILVKVFSAAFRRGPDPATPGAIISDGRTYINVACRDGYVSLLEVQLAGKRPMPVAEFLRGFKGITEHTFI